MEFECKVEKKIDTIHKYSPSEIQRGKFSVIIEQDSQSFLSRCSFSPSAQAVTCDRYAVDHIVNDQNVKIKKYYIFRSMFDVQVFSDLSFVENNGRGGIAFGKCQVKAP